MNAALMQMAFEAPPAAPPKGAGKPAASQGKDGGEFGAVFAGLVAAGQPQTGEGQKTDAENPQTAVEAAPVFAPGMWTVATLFAQMPQTTTAVLTAAPVADQGSTGAITPLPAAAPQTAQTAQQPLPLPQLTAAQTAVTAEQTPPVANGQQAGQGATPVMQQAQQAQAATATQRLPDLPAVQSMPQVTPAAMTEAEATPLPAVTIEGEAAPIPAAVPVPTPDERPAAAATGQGAAAQRQVEPTVISQATIAAAAAGGQLQPEKPATAQAPVVKAEAEPKALTPTASTAAMPAAAAGGETQTAGGDSAALSAEIFAPAAPNPAPTPETATANQLFAAIVDQAAVRAGAAENTAAPAGNQPAAPQDPHNVAGQIVDNARLITRAESSEMVIKLKPEHLGELTLKIVVDSGVVSATFHTKNAEVRAAIEASLPQLRQDMADQGLKVDNVGVYTSLDHFFANDQRHAPQQQQMPQPARRPSGDEVFADTAAAVTALGVQSAAGGTGIDYRI